MAINENVVKTLERKAFDELKKVGFKIERRAKQLYRDWGAVDTGRLRASITTAASDGTKTTINAKAQTEDAIATPDKPFTVQVGTNVYYGPYIEFGTERMPPRPVLRTAFEEVTRNNPLFKRK